ncbi:uncharacterized protein LOC118200055 isoform X2 [Stegodyphus dumicola]|uniref:uncharacterized protein LOC118200055 isoform X2 n=1 Tax=Stegodyphus dumicola TaxID=202533 RepID=UPI0015B19AED|nr:uncharacterized protein LOC118200055 isoform X2 [Stegodyphus dumicola]
MLSKKGRRNVQIPLGCKGIKIRKRRCAEKLENGCSWTTATNPIYMRSTEKLNFLIVGNNSLGTSEYLFSVDHFKIVKPGAPQRAEFTNITPTSMMLHCTFPKNMMYGEFKPGLLFSIQYRPKDYPAPYKEIRVYFQSQGSLEITDLIPYTEYEFKIRCRSNVSDSDLMWSPLLTASMGTHPDVPYWAPETASSGFDIQVILGNRTISLYWKAIPFNYENGPNLEYMVQYHIHHVPSRIIRESAVFGIGKNTTYSFESMDVNSAYMFNIFARNEIGTSVNTSQIIVDKADKLLDGPRDITVIYNKGNYNISWKAPNNQIKYYTLFWCEGPERGEGAIDWVHVQQTEYQLNLSDKSTWYQFAVAANTDIQTSGMFWASCIVVGGERFEIKSVELTPKHSTSLKIQWSLDCEAQKRIVEHYNIHYCETGRVCSAEANCTNHEKVEVIKNRHLNEYYLVSLKPYTCYKAFMRVLTSNGWSADSNIASESTLSSAPSDSPGDVKILRIDGTKIRISFVPPQIPNGIVTRYVVTYNKTSDGTSHHVQVRVQETKMDHGAYIVDLQKSLFYYSNYSIEVEACVEKACSPPSKPVYALTGISRPGIMKSPSVEILKSSMNISWDPPFLPNGPLDLYQVVKESTNSSIKEEYNITGRNFLILSLACSDEEKEEKIVYSFKVRAVNFRGDMALYGDFSRQTETILCVSSTSFGLIIGSTAGAVIGFVLFVLLMYCVISWMKREVAMIKGINVQLPKGLDSPIDNPLNSYDKFKSGLQKSHDSGIPYDRTYERLCSFASEGDTKDIGNGCILNEEPSDRSKRLHSGRNNSGESDASGKCHDSISSSNTTKTHLSIDSGAEIDSPPSPDGFFSDTSSSNTTPRSYKPDLTIVKESNGSVSRDSGLEKEGTGPTLMSQNIEIPTKYSWYIRKKNCPFLIQKNAGQMPAYSKFAVLPSSTLSYVPYGEQNLGLLEKSSLSNSEPSVSDFDTCCPEPVALSGIAPYSKFGLARSAGNGLNMSNQPFTISTPGYSKFGTTYRALPQLNSSEEKNLPVISSGTKCCLKYVPEGHSALTALALHHSPVYIRPKDLCSGTLPKKYLEKGPVKDEPSNNGYVSYGEAVKYDAYSKVGMASKPDCRSSYVTFQDAKSMNIHSSPKNVAICPASASEPVDSSDFNHEVDKDESSVIPDVKINESLNITVDENHSVGPSDSYTVLSNVGVKETTKSCIPSEESPAIDFDIHNSEHNIASIGELCNDISQINNNENDEQIHSALGSNELDIHVSDSSIDEDFAFYGQTNTEENVRLKEQNISKGYVPFSELSKEPVVVTRPNLAHLPVENI